MLKQQKLNPKEKGNRTMGLSLAALTVCGT